MRMVKRTECEYEDYAKMVDLIDETCPYGLISCRYNKRLKIGFLYFWDSDYIPEEWEEYVSRPVSTKSDKEGVSEEYS